MRTVLLTGIGAPGQVGEVVARAFAEQGDRVLLVGRTESQVRAQADALSAKGFAALAFSCDLSDAAAVDALAERIRDAHSTELDAVVMMAGGFGLTGPIGESRLTDLDHQLSINLKTAVYTTRSFIAMLRQRRGSIVYFASEAILPGGKLAGVSSYAIAKGGVVSLMRAVAQEEKVSGVRANAVAPSSIRTASNLESMGEGATFVTRESVAQVVTFLCSDAGANITGETVHLAGRPSDRVASSA